MRAIDKLLMCCLPFLLGAALACAGLIAGSFAKKASEQSEVRHANDTCRRF